MQPAEAAARSVDPQEPTNVKAESFRKRDAQTKGDTTVVELTPAHAQQAHSKTCFSPNQFTIIVILFQVG